MTTASVTSCQVDSLSVVSQCDTFTRAMPKPTSKMSKSLARSKTSGLHTIESVMSATPTKEMMGLTFSIQMSTTTTPRPVKRIKHGAAGPGLKAQNLSWGLRMINADKMGRTSAATRVHQAVDVVLRI